MVNPYAQALGRLAKGKPKTYTPEQRRKLAESLAQARKKRWPAKSETGNTKHNPETGGNES